MTTGNVSQTTDNYNKSSRIWSGSDTPRGSPRVDHDYTMTNDFIAATKFLSRYWTGSAWIDPMSEYVSGVAGRAPLLGWDASPNLALNTWNELGTKVRGNTFNTGVFLSQLPMAVSQLVGIAGSLLMCIRALRHGDVSGAVRSLVRANGINTMKVASRQLRPAQFVANNLENLEKMLNSNLKSLRVKDISSTWLALQYGVKPALADLSDLADFIAGYHEDRKLVVKTSKSFRTKTHLTAWTGGNHSGTIEVVQGLKYCLKASLVENPPQNSWIGHFDPFQIAWELVPFSFVVDWILPIGTFLETASLFRGLNVDVTLSTLRYAESSGRNLGVDGISGGTGRVWTGGAVREHHAEFIRKCHVPLAAPLPAAKRWKQIFSVTHLENGSALVDQSVRAFHR